MGQILSTLLSEEKCRFIKENIPPKYLPETEHYYVYSYQQSYLDYNKEELVVDVKYNKCGYNNFYDDEEAFPAFTLDDIIKLLPVCIDDDAQLIIWRDGESIYHYKYASKTHKKFPEFSGENNLETAFLCLEWVINTNRFCYGR